MKLDVESLRALRLVVETGGFTEAAARMGVTQSAVSWKIKRLEERVGTELVERGPEVMATPDGRDLLFYVDQIVETHDRAVEHLSRSDRAGVIRLGANEDLRGGTLAAVLARFGRKYPRVRLDVRIQLSGRVRRWLDDGEIDLAVLQLPADQVDRDDVVLWREPLAWVTGRGHHFDPADNQPIPVVTFGPGLAYGDRMEASLQGLGVRWRTVLESPMLSGVQAAVEAGLGVTALNPRIRTDSMVEWEHRRGDEGLPDICEVIRVSSDRSSPPSDDDPEILVDLVASLETALAGGRGSGAGPTTGDGERNR